MSLYNMLFGVNEKLPVLLGVLGLKIGDVPRLRDVFMDDKCIVIHTRTGGGNRDYYDCEEKCRNEYPEYFEGDDVPSGPWNDDLRKHPNYLYDQDDDYDCTYANFYFSFPDEYKEDLVNLANNSQDAKPSEKWQALMDSMKAAQ